MMSDHPGSVLTASELIVTTLNGFPVPSDDVLMAAPTILKYFLAEIQVSSVDSLTTATLPPSFQDDSRSKLSHSFIQVSHVLLSIASANNKKTTRKALEHASKLLLFPGGQSGTSTTSTTTTSWWIVACVGAALALDSEQDQQQSRAAGSALASTMQAIRSELASDEQASLLAAKEVIQALIVQEATTEFKVDWHIITGLSRALGMDATSNVKLSQAVATVVRRTIESDEASEDKLQVAAILALATVFQPWNDISPIQLIEAAIPLDLWHAAEHICVSASRSSDGETAILTLIDAALEAKTYRRADAFATEFYDMGGRSRFLEARFWHACDTIVKVVRKRALPVMERQVERIDKAVEKVLQDPMVVVDDDSLAQTAKEEIRTFVLRQLEESGDVEMAHRLAGIWNMEYVYDEEAVLAAQEARRKKYLQWEDVLPGSPPELLSTPEALLEAFANLHLDTTLGFDCEWGEDNKGVDLLQLANMKTALLIDIPALSCTVDGANALEQTVARLFASPSSTMVGFACRQDLSRLRSSPCARAVHWFGKSDTAVDLQLVVTEKDRKLAKLGLSRVCHNYLGKPLDKAEQCSMWTARPLSLQQRVYGALDAWVCVAVYDKIT
jgi:hypothetical protein